MPSNLLMKYINQCCTILKWLGVHPEKVQPWYFFFTFLNIVMIFLVILVLFYKDHAITFTDIIDTFSNCALMLHGIARLLNFYLKRASLLDLIQGVQHRFWKLEGLTTQERTHYYEMIRVTKLKFYLLAFSAVSKSIVNSTMALFSDNDMVIINCYRFEAISPYVTWLYQTIFTHFCIHLPVISMDSLIMIFISLTQMQYEMLNREIERVFRRAVRGDRYDSNIAIGRIIDHHNFLIEYTNRINDTFSNVLLAYLFLYGSSMCLEVYNSSEVSSLEASMNALTYLIAATFGFVFLFCIPAQNLTNEANKTANAVYFSDWYHETKHSTAIMMMIANGQREVSIMAGRVVNINLATGLATFKSVVSYFMFLRTVTTVE